MAIPQWRPFLALIFAGLVACTSHREGTPNEAYSEEGGSVTGQTWSGTASDDVGGTLKTDFVLSEDAGTLSGFHVLYDPTTGAPIKAGDLSGQRIGNAANWTTMGGLLVTGTFNGDEFAGSATFPGALSYPPRVTKLRLTLGRRDQ
jgi:hypothetical protein